MHVKPLRRLVGKLIDPSRCNQAQRFRSVELKSKIPGRDGYNICNLEDRLEANAFLANVSSATTDTGFGALSDVANSSHMLFKKSCLIAVNPDGSFVVGEIDRRLLPGVPSEIIDIVIGILNELGNEVC